MSNYLDEIVRLQKRGEARGIPSICSAHPWVLKAAMSRLTSENRAYLAGSGTATPGDVPLLIESTCNQVNQFGGYTGMTPATFVAYVCDLAAENAFSVDRLILGGDHLGPSLWQKEPSASAMQKAADMLRDYVLAGFTKLHLDVSMRLADDDPSSPMDVELVARRTVFLVRAAEEAYACAGTAPSLTREGAGAGTGGKVLESSQGLRYVIGSEVPIPGGATTHEDGVSVTTVEDTRRTLEVMQTAFLHADLESAWERVIALVVQPGVEFGDDFVLDYNPVAARSLSRFAETIPFVYEAHSTDYQTVASLRQLLQDHFAILKVGPALTYAFREAVFALARMENELFSPADRSRLVEILDEAMLQAPANWKDHYHGTLQEMAFSRKYSLSDRIRYYWNVPQVQSALGRLLQNFFGKKLPPSLVSQFMPRQWEKIRAGQIGDTPEALIIDKVISVLEAYDLACG